MYLISVPVMNGNLERNGRERTLEELKKFDAKLMRFVYKNKYSKKETEVKTAEVK